MKHLDRMIELVEQEMDTFAQRGKLGSYENVKTVGELVDIIKDIYCIMDMEEGGASEAAYMYGNNYADGMNYNRGGSYARRGGRRDSMGRFTSRMNGEGSYRNGGMSHTGTREDFIDNLRDMIDEAPDEMTRQNIRNLLAQMGR